MLKSQQPRWTLPPLMLNMSGQSPFPESNSLLSNNLPYPASNSAYDKDGHLLFYIMESYIYDKNNTQIDYLPFRGTEIQIVKVPDSPNKYYILGIQEYVGQVPKLVCYTLEYIGEYNQTYYGSQHPFFVGAAVEIGEISDIPYSEGTSPYIGLAVSKLRDDGSRLLFAFGSGPSGGPLNTTMTMKKFKITKEEVVSYNNTVVNLQIPRKYISELDLYEDSNGYKLVWGTIGKKPWLQDPGFAGNGIGTLMMDSSGNDIELKHYNNDGNGDEIGTVVGVEFIDNNTVLINSLTKGIGKLNLTSSSISFQSQPYYNQSQIEKAKNGKYYVSSDKIYDKYWLAYINLNNLSVTDEVEIPQVPSYGAWNNATQQNFVIKTLLDQIQDEDYIAANYPADLMARDDNGSSTSPMDIGTEPNSSVLDFSQIWNSRDIWNRSTYSNLSIEANYSPENVDCAQGHSNLLRFRIKNNGAVATTTYKHAKLYWTVGTTGGEPWPSAWDGSTVIFYNGIYMAIGKEIKTPFPTPNTVPNQYPNINTGDVNFPSSYDNDGFLIPPLQPGQEYIINALWTPSYLIDCANRPQICFLGRITEDISIPELIGFNTIGTNVQNNNNIVTRNTSFINLSGQDQFARKSGTIFVSNSMMEDKIFNINFAEIYKSGKSFKEIGSLILTLDNELWHNWFNSGALKEGIEISNVEKHELKVTNLQTARLVNVNLKANEYRSITLSFELTSATNLLQDHHFTVSQRLTETPDQHYGSICNFFVAINKKENTGEIICEDGKNCSVESSHTTAFKGDIILSPNPSSGNTTLNFELLEDNNIIVAVVDIYGKIVLTPVNKSYYKSGANTVNFSTASLPEGVYLVTVHANNERKSRQLIVKQ